MPKPQRFLFIGAHPDDPEACAGTAVKLIQNSHAVRFVSVTDGGSGHHIQGGRELVARRQAEAREAAKRFGLDAYIIMDNPDGYLTPDIPTRCALMKVIREFGPDYIVTHRPNDYHPDHRAVGQLVMDCSYLVRVPNFLPTVPIPAKMPVIFYHFDFFTKPVAFNPDIVIGTDDVLDRALYACDAHESQMYEWLPLMAGDLENVPAGQPGRLGYLRKTWAARWEMAADKYRDKLIETYGAERGNAIQYAEAFEACEYGAEHDIEAERRLFLC